MPAAIGAKLGAGDTPVVAIAGDYGFQYTLNELAVATELGQQLIVVLWNSAGLQAIMDDMDRKEIGHIATNPMNPDFELFARAYGCKYRKVGAIDAIAGAMAEALEATGPFMVEIDATALNV